MSELKQKSKKPRGVASLIAGKCIAWCAGVGPAELIRSMGFLVYFSERISPCSEPPVWRPIRFRRPMQSYIVHPEPQPEFLLEKSKIGGAVLDFMFDTTRIVTNMVLSGTKQRFPGINIISTHGGGTISFLASRISQAGATPWGFSGGSKRNSSEIIQVLGSFYFDLTASTMPALLDAIRRLVPADRLLMGFDFPLMPSQTIPIVRYALFTYSGFDDEEKSKTASGNAGRLFPRFA